MALHSNRSSDQLRRSVHLIWPLQRCFGINLFFSQHSAWWTLRSFQGRVLWRHCRRLQTSRHHSSWWCRWWLLPWRTARPPCPWCSRRWPQLEGTPPELWQGNKHKGKVNHNNTDLSLNKPWVPIGGLRQRRDRCNEQLLPPLPHSPRVVEEVEERALQTHWGPLEEVVEVEQDCLWLKTDSSQIYQSKSLANGQIRQLWVRKNRSQMDMALYKWQNSDVIINW